jgi:TMEM175 potassium channel family protein
MLPRMGDTRSGTEGDERTESMDTGRVLALSDGVLAIAATLLVLDLRLPEGLDAAGVDRAIHELLPSIGGYALSYVLIGVTWLAHHRMFRLISPISDRVARLNILFLGVVSVVPFVTSAIARYGSERLPTAMYGGVTALIFLLELAMLGVASRQGAITDRPGARALAYRAAAGVLVFGSSVVIAAVDATWAASAAKYSWIAVMPARLIASRLARR